MSSVEDALLQDVQTLVEETLRPRADLVDYRGEFPDEQMRVLARAGLPGMAIDRVYGGLGLSPTTQARIFLELTAGCATTAFVLSQHHVTTALLSVSENEAVRERWLHGLADGSVRGADGINFLRMPAERAPMRAEEVPGGWRLRGMLPWVTASHHSDLLVCGAVLKDGRQIVVALPMDHRVRCGEAARLMAFEASDTGPVFCDDCFVPKSELVLGPYPDILTHAPRAATTYVPIAMALGHARSSLASCQATLAQRGADAVALGQEVSGALETLERETMDGVQRGDSELAPRLRGRANYLVGRAAHLALIVGGGSGYRRESLPQRLFREAAFWSVWSVGGQIMPETLKTLLAH